MILSEIKTGVIFHFFNKLKIYKKLGNIGTMTVYKNPDGKKFLSRSSRKIALGKPPLKKRRLLPNENPN